MSDRDERVSQPLADQLAIEEIIRRGAAPGGDRVAMVEALKGLHYSTGEHAPAPYEGSTTTAWDEILDALFAKALTRDEFEAIRAAAGPDRQEHKA